MSNCRRAANDDQDNPLFEILDAIHGDDVGQFIGRHHVRFLKEDIVYHAVSRVAAGMALLVPTDELNRIMVGVIARALALYPEIKLYGFVFMSNHFHLELEGGPWISRFMRYVKGQISLRVKDIVGREGPTLWDGEFAAAGLPTARSQLRAFRYILSHGVKEGLVERPEQWPRLQCAKQLFCHEPLEGEWFDGTRYAKAVYRESRKPKDRRRSLSRDAFTVCYADLQILDRLPALAHLDEAQFQERLRTLHADIIEEGRVLREGKPALGVEAVRSTPRRTKFAVPRPPWLRRGRRMICWENRSHPEARAYLLDYWEHQIRHRQATDRFLRGEIAADFPTHSHRPCAPVNPMPRRFLDEARWEQIVGSRAA